MLAEQVLLKLPCQSAGAHDEHMLDLGMPGEEAHGEAQKQEMNDADGCGGCEQIAEQHASGVEPQMIEHQDGAGDGGFQQQAAEHNEELSAQAAVAVGVIQSHQGEADKLDAYEQNAQKRLGGYVFAVLLDDAEPYGNAEIVDHGCGDNIQQEIDPGIKMTPVPVRFNHLLRL